MWAVAIVCALGVLTSALAQSGEVYSLNVVGFQKVTAPPAAKKYTLNSTPFIANNPNINYAIGNQLGGSNSVDNSDNILLWNKGAQAYKRYWLAGNVGDTNYNYKWIDNLTGEVATNTDILPGEGFWVRSRQSVTQVVVVAGDVEDAQTVTNGIAAGYQLLSYPFSAPIGLNSTTFTNGGKGSNSVDNSDNIMKWNVNAQTYLRYWLAGNVGDTNYNRKWIDNLTGEVATNAYLNPGDGFWYRHRGSGFNWVEAKPYTVP